MSRYKIQLSRGSGKACQGAAKTRTVQVVEPLNKDSYLLKKQFQYRTDNRESTRHAWKKAEDWIKEQGE